MRNGRQREGITECGMEKTEGGDYRVWNGKDRGRGLQSVEWERQKEEITECGMEKTEGGDIREKRWWILLGKDGGRTLQSVGKEVVGIARYFLGTMEGGDYECGRILLSSRSMNVTWTCRLQTRELAVVR